MKQEIIRVLDIKEVIELAEQLKEQNSEQFDLLKNYITNIKKQSI